MGQLGTATTVAQPRARGLRRLTALGAAVSLGMLAVGGFVLLQARNDAWRQAVASADNLTLALERDIARNITIYDLSLQGTIATLQEPGLDAVSPAIRQAAVFDAAASAEYLGSMLVLDTSGTIVLESTAIVPHALNLADRDYFQVHRASPGVGLFISRPYRSRLRPGEPSIAISRRITRPDGGFGGVALGAMKLSYFQALFDRLDLGKDGTVTLARTDGHIVAHAPFREGDFDRAMDDPPPLAAVPPGQLGHYVATDALDGVRRLYSYHQVGDLPLVLRTGVSMGGLYGAWWRKAAVIGGILGLLCSATVALCVLFRMEVARRMAAEAALVTRAEALSVMAATDGLTGLGNRRAFEAEMVRAWRHAIRNEEPLSLLMIDADHFKLYNDRYGHQAGDRVLRGIATCIQQNVRRPRDLGARYGGEEFVVLLPDTTPAGAAGVAERIRAAVTALAIAHEGSPYGFVTVSIGAAAARPAVDDRDTWLVKQADQALYDAKRGGRNRVGAAPAAAEPAVEWATATTVFPA